MERSEFLIPVFRDIRADIETPVSAYWKLSFDQKYSYLLESVTGGENLARYSILGVRPSKVIRTKNRQLTIESFSDEGQSVETSQIPFDQDPLSVLKEQLGPWSNVPIPGAKHFIGGAVGMLSYDLVRFFEKLPDSCEDDLQMDDVAMMITRVVVVFDHVKQSLRLIAMADSTEESYRRAEDEIQWAIDRLNGPLPALPANEPVASQVTTNQTQEQFEAVVQRMREYVAAGDGVQMVPSMRFNVDGVSDPLSVYRALRTINPSPYMFLLRFGDFELIGASPEIMVSLKDQRARVRPIAGTRWRGKNEQEDAALAEELLQDEKEIAEHIMLVDLGRNDLGRVCEIGSVTVNELMVIEKYSHVMHIVSDVTGTLCSEMDAFDLIRATVPAGTVSGAPKVRAMQIIDELEPTRRGAYAGTVGFIGFDGNMDTCIALRTIIRKGSRAFVQAGCGVVYDSNPHAEYVEVCNKAKACLTAIEVANRGI